MNESFLNNPNRTSRHNQKSRPKMPDAEAKLWSELRVKQLGANFKRQVTFGPYTLDFYSREAKLVIELNGKRHYTDEGRQKDTIRDEYLRKEGLTILRFSHPEVLANINGVLQRIWLHANKKIDEPV